MKIKNNIDTILIFLLITLLYFPVVNNYCQVLEIENFDSQNLLLWSYLSDLGAVPVRDFFHPHSNLVYYAANNSFVFLLYLLTVPFIFTTIYYSFKKIFKARPITLLIFLLFFINISSIIDFRTFSRYGLLLAFIIIFSTILVTDSKRKFYLIGLLSGLVLLPSFGVGLIIFLVGFTLVVASSLTKELAIKKKITFDAVKKLFIGF
jgi:hypothetical protein